MTRRYPHVTVQLKRLSGDAVDIGGRCLAAMREAGLSRAEQEAFADAMWECPSYHDFLVLVMRWFRCT